MFIKMRQTQILTFMYSDRNLSCAGDITTRMHQRRKNHATTTHVLWPDSYQQLM